MRLKNKISLITGAAQGIGAEVAFRFSEEGATVFVADLKEDEGIKTVEKIEKKGGKAFFVKLNVSDEENWKKALQFVIEKCGSINILVNNAGINIRETIE
jgi:NAD(P)-dependent dehydrogenase (short-subunit alcohol dehydrogenase family)